MHDGWCKELMLNAASLKRLVSLRTTPIKDCTGPVLKDGLAWPTISKLRGTTSEIYKA
jgi:hypothetical protein